MDTISIAVRALLRNFQTDHAITHPF